MVHAGGEECDKCQVVLESTELVGLFSLTLPASHCGLTYQRTIFCLFPWAQKLCLCLFLVPLRAPEISLTSRSPTDILISWLPIPAKYRRGRVVLYRVSFRLSTESKVQVLELPGSADEHLLEGLRPDSVYLVRITAATRVGWGEASLWTSHRTPKATSVKGKAGQLWLVASGVVGLPDFISDCIEQKKMSLEAKTSELLANMN